MTCANSGPNGCWISLRSIVLRFLGLDRVGGGDDRPGVEGIVGTERFRDIDPEDNDVAAVEMDAERERERLAFVDTEPWDWCDNRGGLFAG